VTESAVRVTLPAFDLAAYSDTSRSQHQNRHDALSLLRRRIALHIRSAAPSHWEWDHSPGKNSDDYILWLAHLLDVLHDFDYALGAAASFCNLSTGRLVKLLFRDSDAWAHVNDNRKARGLRPLKPPRS